MSTDQHIPLQKFEKTSLLRKSQETEEQSTAIVARAVKNPIFCLFMLTATLMACYAFGIYFIVVASRGTCSCTKLQTVYNFTFGECYNFHDNDKNREDCGTCNHGCCYKYVPDESSYCCDANQCTEQDISWKDVSSIPAWEVGLGVVLVVMGIGLCVCGIVLKVRMSKRQI